MYTCDCISLNNTQLYILYMKLKISAARYCFKNCSVKHVDSVLKSQDLLQALVEFSCWEYLNVAHHQVFSTTYNNRLYLRSMYIDGLFTPAWYVVVETAIKIVAALVHKCWQNEKGLSRPLLDFTSITDSTDPSEADSWRENSLLQSRDEYISNAKCVERTLHVRSCWHCSM